MSDHEDDDATMEPLATYPVTIIIESVEKVPAPTVDEDDYFMQQHLRLAAAEQRASESEARAERLAARLRIAERVCKAVGMYESSTTAVVPYTEPKMRDAYATWRSYVYTRAALTAPATQPDERAAAEQDVIAAALSYYQKEYDGTVPARGMREAFQALWRTIKALGDLIATERVRAPDGAAKKATP